MNLNRYPERNEVNVYGRHLSLKKFLDDLGKTFSFVMVFTLVSILLIPIGFYADLQILQSLGSAFGLIGILAALCILVSRLTRFTLSLRRAIKQSYDRQLKLTSYIERKMNLIASAEAVEEQLVNERPETDEKGKDSSNLSWTDFKNHGYGVDFEYSRRVREGRSALNSFALTSKSLRVRDPLALAATNDRWRERDLKQFFRLESEGYIDSRESDWNREFIDVRNLLRFAGVLTNQRALSSDLDDANKIYNFVRKHWGYQVFPKYDRFLAVEASMECNHYRGVNQSFTKFGLARESIQKRLFTANSAVVKDKPDLEFWTKHVSELYTANELFPVELDSSLSNGNSSLLDRVISIPKRKIENSVKVTVLVPTFNADTRIFTAVKSLLNQTWQNLEIIIIDDGSPEHVATLLQSVADMDSRIKLHFLGSNRGTYIARNMGLEFATGEFITVHDDDDWSHPEKIEYQVRDLLNNPDKIANASNHVRTTENLFFLRLNNNPRLTQLNFSSIMFRRSLIDEIGMWNPVNRSGDSEYKDRIEAYSDQKIESVLEVPMSFTRTGNTSLTQGEMERGYVDSSRRFYIQAYQAGHQASKCSLAWKSVGNSLPGGVPENLRDGKRNVDLGHYDILYVTDFRFPGGNSSLSVAEIRVLMSEGYRVGIIQLDSPVNAPSTPISLSVLELLNSEQAPDVLSLLDVASTKLLIVRNPSVAQFIDNLTTNITADNIVLIVNSTPVLSDGSGQVFDLEEVRANLFALFNEKATLISESVITRKLAGILGHDSFFHDSVWPGMIDESRFKFVPRSPDPGRLPVVGRHSRDSLLKWPEDIDTFRQVYIQPQRFRTTVLGGLSETRKMLSNEDLEALEVYEFGALKPEEYLAKLDFWVYFTSTRWKESFGMSVAEALASGLVVILPHNLKSTFGEGAIYCEPSEVARTIQVYWSSPELYKLQAQKARDYCEDRFSAAALIERIEMAMQF